MSLSNVLFCLSPGGKTFLTYRGGGGMVKHFYTAGKESFSVGIRGGNDDVDGGKEDNVSERSKLSAGAKIFRGP